MACYSYHHFLELNQRHCLAFHIIAKDIIRLNRMYSHPKQEKQKNVNQKFLVHLWGYSSIFHCNCINRFFPSSLKGIHRLRTISNNFTTYHLKVCNVTYQGGAAVVLDQLKYSYLNFTPPDIIFYQIYVLLHFSTAAVLNDLILSASGNLKYCCQAKYRSYCSKVNFKLK